MHISYTVWFCMHICSRRFASVHARHSHAGARVRADRASKLLHERPGRVPEDIVESQIKHAVALTHTIRNASTRSCSVRLSSVCTCIKRRTYTNSCAQTNNMHRQQSCIHRCHTHKQEFLREASNDNGYDRDEHVKAQLSAAHWTRQKGLIC